MDTLFGEDDLMPERVPPGKEFVSKLEELMPAEELDFDSTPGFGDYKAIMPADAVAHPAKMNTALLRYLIERYTKPGETLCDPMSGSGSTGMLGALHGRNAVLVELEAKFVKWQEEARQRLEALPSLTEKGKVTIIKGDARNLSRLLGRSPDAEIVSPPYSDSRYHVNKSPEFWEIMAKSTGRPAWADPNSQTRRNAAEQGKGYSSEGVDAVVSSPPFSDTLHPRKGVLQAQANMKEAGYDPKYIKGSFEQPNQQLALAKEGYSSDPENIGNLKHGEVDAVVTSPPYKTRTDGGGINETGIPNARGVHEDRPDTLSYSEDKEGNIGETKELGEVDSVITSPPYAESVIMSYDSPEMHAFFAKMLKEKGFIEWEGRRYTEEEWRKMNHGRLDGRTTKGIDKGSVGYSGAPENIGNLATGDVDAVVTSPPYANSAGRQDDRDEFFDRLASDPTSARFGRKSRPKTAAAYSQSKENIGNLPVPEYGGLTKEEMKEFSAKMVKRLLTGEKIKVGLVDGIVTSPPYERSEAMEDTSFVKGIQEDQSKKLREGKMKGNYRSPEAERRYLDKVERGRVEDPESIGKLEKETYLQAMYRVYGEMWAVLKPGGRAVIVIKPFARDHKVVDLPWQTWLLLEKIGFQLEGLLKLRLKNLSFWRILYYRRFPQAERIVHEYCIVVVKKPLTTNKG
jgi:DNA modification methylase